MPKNQFDTLPSLPIYCGVPETISADASVPERQDLLQRWCSITKYDFDCLPCVLEMGTALRERLYAYIWQNLLRLIPWSVLDFEDFRSTLLEIVELSACWAKLPAHVWLDYAAETTPAFSKPRELTAEEIVLVKEAVVSL